MYKERKKKTWDGFPFLEDNWEFETNVVDFFSLSLSVRMGDAAHILAGNMVVFDVNAHNKYKFASPYTFWQ